MLRFFSRNRSSIDKAILSGEPNSFTILPAGRASILADGAIFLNIEKGVIFKSNRIGSRIWQGVVNQESPASMAAQISHEYAIPEEKAFEDTARFLVQLESEGFLVRSGSGQRP